MKIINRTKNTTLAQEVVVAQTTLKRMRGLLGKNELPRGQALILEPCDSVHTFFMRFPIDVLFVNNKYRVIKAISNLVPFRMTRPYFTAFLAIELPAGTIQATFTAPGDFLIIE